MVATTREKASPGVTAPLPEDLHPALHEALSAAGIEALWSHQADVARERPAGSHDRHDRHRQRQVALPSTCRCCDTLARRPDGARALPLPDQGARPGPGAQARPARRRHAARREDAVPAPRDLRRRHARAASGARSASARTWSSPTPTCCTSGRAAQPPPVGRLLANLAWVVVDEAHVYRGVFGSHVANVLRRLRRLAARLRHRAALRAAPARRSPTRCELGRAADRASSSRWSTATARRTPSARS